jgi:hypothetical protein
MARVKIPGIGSGSVNRIKSAVAKATGAKSKAKAAPFIGRKSKLAAKAKGGRWVMLREEFEPLLLSPHGLHHDPEICRMAWDAKAEKIEDWPRYEAILQEEIARGDEWLRLCGRTIHVNQRCGTRYGLKHIAEDWHEASGRRNGYMANGCFLMAAQRLGFQMRGVWGNYCFGGGFVRDTFNAHLNISSKHWPETLLRAGWCPYRRNKKPTFWRRCPNQNQPLWLSLSL